MNSERFNSGDMETKNGQAFSPSGDARFGWRLVLLALAIGFLWFKLLSNLRLEWATDPQYSYGWAVPLLCLGLLLRRWHRLGQAESKKEPISGGTAEPGFERLAVVGFVMLAFLYLPTRLIGGATPEWRPIQWLLGVETIGLTLCAICLGKGRKRLGQLAFPICFFFVAIPWPTLIETPIIQGLTRFNSSMVVEVLGVFGVPAAQHGNVIEVGTGLVGIDDACSGIRSFQSSVMISLFLGEFYWLSRSRRLLLIPTSFVLAIAFNVCRTTILTFIAAKKGTAAIAEYHDGAGFLILAACFATTWGVALLLKRNEDKVARAGVTAGGVGSAPREADGVEANDPGASQSPTRLHDRISLLKRLGVGLLVWLVVVEAGVELWYRIREAQLKPGPTWSVAFPVENSSFTASPIPEKTRYLLRYDDGKQGQWTEPDGSTWQAFYFNWRPGRVAGYLAKRHEPEICLPAAGATMRSGPKLKMLNVHGVVLPMRCYEFETTGGLLNVYQCRWEAGAGPEAYVAEDAARYNLIRAVWAGRGNQGQKVIEIVVAGITDPEEAMQALERQLDKLIQVQKQGGGTEMAGEGH